MLTHPVIDAGGPIEGVEHSAFFYDGYDEYVNGLVAFVQEGLDHGEAVLVSVPAAHLDLLSPHLHFDGTLLRAVPMEVLGRNPAWIIPVWVDFIDEQAGRPARGVGEPIWTARSAEELVECTRHEELLNVAIEHAAGFRLLCPYDTRSLGDDVIESACRNHPHLRDGAVRPNLDFSLAVDPRLTVPLPPPPASAERSVFADVADIAPLRHRVVDAAGRAGLPANRLDDLAIAVSEAMANSVAHAGGRGELWAWATDGAFLCEIRDDGAILDPMAGRRRPTAGQDGGRGLWLIHQLCDLVQIRALPEGRQAIRLRVVR